MNLERELVFCFIEEDNIQRAYFRVRPLLTVSGAVQDEAQRLWPDDGCLRIVPDRNEQHTFKERMRTLGSWCVMNLVGISADANKIRTNKNYKPDKGERNQFILYSDTVQALPEHTFFQVLEGSAGDYAALAAKAITPLFYIRENDTLYGPVSKQRPAQPETAQEAFGVLYPLACPDGAERVMLCIAQTPDPMPAPDPKPVEKPEAAPIAEEKTETTEESLPIGKPLQILDENKDFEETLHGLDQPLSEGANLLRTESRIEETITPPVNNRPLSGTPLVRATMRTAQPQPKNKLQEVVSAQWRVARNEPPTAPLPAGAAMRQVENPVEVACDSLGRAWQVTEAHHQLIDFILSLDGMRAKLEPRMTEGPESTPLYKTLKSRLDDMEAERLAALLELDKAKADLDAYRRSVLDGMSERSKAEVTRLEKTKNEYESSVTSLKQQQNALIAQRDELTRRVEELQRIDLPAALAKAMADAQLAAPITGTPLHLNPVCGENIPVNELIRRVNDALAASGLNAQRNQIIALLGTLSACSRIGVASVTTAAAATLVGNIARRLGWGRSYAHQVTPEQKPVLGSTPAEGTPAVLLTSLAAYAPLDGITKVFLARSAMNQTRNTAYEATPWPIFPLGALPIIPLLTENNLSPVSFTALTALDEGKAVSLEEVRAVLGNVLKQIAPLSGAALSEMHRFISACTPLMEGGLAAACDWAILLWVIPAVERVPRVLNALKPLLEEYPLSLAALQS